MSLAPADGAKMVRVLQCLTDKTMQVMPYYGTQEHPTPQDDALMDDLVAQHGGIEAGHIANAFIVEESRWDNPQVRRQIVEQMWSGVKGFTPSYYDAKDTFKDDAMKCWINHRRPGVSTHLCSDYRNDNRRIGNPAYRDRLKLSQELRSEEIKYSGPKIYLCDLCPYSVDVQRMKADKYGDFSEKLT